MSVVIPVTFDAAENDPILRGRASWREAPFADRLGLADGVQERGGVEEPGAGNQRLLCHRRDEASVPGVETSRLVATRVRARSLGQAGPWRSR